MKVQPKSPILLLGYNRPAHLGRVIDSVRRYQPNRVYLSVDGPNPRKPNDAEKVIEVQQLSNKIDWECDVRVNFLPTNMGCGRAVSSGISWFFDQETEGIILEDDCVPNLSFFEFLNQMLSMYRDEPRVWGATGSNTFGLKLKAGRDYDFISYPLIWGWATWANRWRRYDFHLDSWHTTTEANSRRSLRDWRESAAMADVLSLLKQGCGPDTWDYQWVWTVRRNNGLWILPGKNMLTNIGFGPEATHTFWEGPESNREIFDEIPVVPPVSLEANMILDRDVLSNHFSVARTRVGQLMRRKRAQARRLYRKAKSWIERCVEGPESG